MKSKKILILTFLLTITALFSFKKYNESSPYKCMIQMTNYSGEGAYIIISLINPKGEYEETLYVQGNDDEWYFDMKEWWNFQGKKKADIDAITGATISGGQRKISVIRIDDNRLNKGYKIRFETAVENQKYYKNDVEFDFITENLNSKVEGKGFIRYIRMIKK